MNTIVDSKKSRNLSTFQFFEQLQLEYVVAELRKKIYPSIKDKNYYKRVMIKKKEKIEDIASRNVLPSIFTGDTSYKNKIYGQVYNEVGAPTFIYKDKVQKREFAEQDLFNYYLVGSEVKVHRDTDKISVGRIELTNLSAGLVLVKLGIDEAKNFDISRVTRIL